MRRRMVRAAVAVGISAGTVVGLAGPAWAPKITFGPNPADACKDGGWEAKGYRNQGQCIAEANRGPK